MELGLSGLASGFDWRSLVNQLADVERAPQRRLLNEQDRLNERRNAYSSIQTQLTTLQNKIEALSDPQLFDSRSTTSSDKDIASIAAETGAPTGSYEIEVLGMATSSVWKGSAGIASKLSVSDDVSTLALSDASFYRSFREGVFSVNGERVELTGSDTLQDVFDKIYTATGGDVSASYNSNTDRIELASSNEIILGSANDTSNFLQLTRLNNNGTGVVSSSARIGSGVVNGDMADSNLATPISDGGSGEGKFLINGVEITFDTSTDAVTDVLNRINTSKAGVSASYDTVSGNFTLTNKKTGDLGITMQDVSGNFLAATGLSGATMERGQNLRYTLNGGSELQSYTNKIDEESSGLQGITIDALTEGKVTLNVVTDENKIRSAIQAFITDYNSAQNLIDSSTQVETSSDGTVDAAILAGELDASQIATSLRGLANGQVSGPSPIFNLLSKFGINSNGDDNTIALTDSAALTSAIQDNLEDLKAFFSDEESGFTSRFKNFLDATIGDDGTLVQKQANLNTQASNINTQVDDLEKIVQANRQLLIDRFISMETAQSKANQQLQFLTNNFG